MVLNKQHYTTGAFLSYTCHYWEICLILKIGYGILAELIKRKLTSVQVVEAFGSGECLFGFMVEVVIGLNYTPWNLRATAYKENRGFGAVPDNVFLYTK